MPRRVSTPSVLMAAITGRILSVVALALARFIAGAGLFPDMRFATLPSGSPLAFLAAKPALVRSLISCASYSATADFIWIMKRFAESISAALKSTPLSSKADTKETLRANPSSFATIRIALCRFACASALISSGRSFFSRSRPLRREERSGHPRYPLHILNGLLLPPQDLAQTALVCLLRHGSRRGLISSFGQGLNPLLP